MAELGKLALTDPDDVEQKIEAYFQSRLRTRFVPTGRDPKTGDMIYEREEYMAPPTMAGLALALGVTRVTLLFYSKGEGTRDPRLIPILARAKMRIAEWWEEALADRGAATGAQFALRVNHNYGLEDQAGGGSGFTQNVIPPASADQIEAVPKWNPEGDDDE